MNPMTVRHDEHDFFLREAAVKNTLAETQVEASISYGQ
jgi:hypothetical protein